MPSSTESPENTELLTQLGGSSYKHRTIRVAQGLDMSLPRGQDDWSKEDIPHIQNNPVTDGLGKILEAKEHVEKPYRSKRHKKHSNLPKKTLTAFLPFFKEKRSQYSQKYPKLSNQELTNLLSEEYKELPEQIRLKYVHDFQKDKQELEKQLAQFKTDH
ncbi:hypothetical protein GH733_007275 [Mirounga leonina]|nr:hypothetical protein GH733_007275 [Mirounga leonina]